MAQPLTRMEAFVRDLPRGLDSYPEHLQKGSVFRVVTETLPLAEHSALLPAPLAELVRLPPPVSSWLPEVHATAVYLAAADLLFPDDDAFVNFCYESNRRLLNGPIYWALFRLVGAEKVIKGAETRWGQMHKGIRLLVHEAPGPNQATISMEFPRGLVTGLLARAYATALRAAVEVAGGHHVEFNVQAQSDTSITFRGRWS